MRQCKSSIVYTTGVNPAGDAGDTSPNILVGGTNIGWEQERRTPLFHPLCHPIDALGKLYN